MIILMSFIIITFVTIVYLINLITFVTSNLHRRNNDVKHSNYCKKTGNSI